MDKIIEFVNKIFNDGSETLCNDGNEADTEVFNSNNYCLKIHLNFIKILIFY